MRTKLLGLVVVSTALAVGISHSFAEEIAPTSQQGVQVGAWTLFPSIFAGAVYNDNLGQSTPGTASSSGAGFRTVPRLLATYDGGIYKTTLYGVVDGEFFSAPSVDSHFFDTNTIAATAGFAENYEAMRDLLFSFYGNYTRETDIFHSAVNFNNGAIGPQDASSNIPLVINPFGTVPTVNPIPFNQFTGGGAVAKTFGQAFVTLGGNASRIEYDHFENVPQPFQTSLDGTNVWVSGRAGYHVTPGLYVFAQSDGIFQFFDNSLFNTNGYRVVGGVGSDDRESLYRGEVYGGYQAQHQLNQNVNGFGVFGQSVIGSGIPADINSPVFGGRLYYYPTRYWTFIASVDETLGMSTFLSPSVPAGTPSLVTTAMLQTTYAIARDWSIGARFGYTRGQFFGISDLQNGWLAGASFNYQIWRNLSLTLDYQYTTVRSNVAFSEFTQNAYTVGLTYKY